MRHQAVAYPRLAHRIEDAVAVSGIGRSTLFEHIRHGRLKSIKIGGLRLIPDASLRVARISQNSDGEIIRNNITRGQHRALPLKGRKSNDVN